ncbi:MAG: hypothetical protein ACQETD_03055 [Pseudomonadota bacterium]
MDSSSTGQYLRSHDKQATLFALNFRPQLLFAGPVADLVRKLSLQAGLGQSHAEQFTLATEELLAYLAAVMDNHSVDARLAASPTGLMLTLRFPGEPTRLHHFNLATDRSQYQTGETNVDGLGLYLAARMVSDFHVAIDTQHIELALAQDRPYPMAKALAPGETLRAPFKLVEQPNADLIELACAHTLASVANELYPPEVLQPARLEALIAAGSADATVITDQSGQVAGWILWTLPNSKTAQFFGPYVFSQPDQDTLSDNLCERMIARLGKTSVKSLFNGLATAQTPVKLFEQIRIPGQQTPPIFYRQLREDSGAVTRCPNSLSPVLRKLYDSLFLMREIVPAPEMAHRSISDSVFNVSLNQRQQTAHIQLLLAGHDFADAVRTHLDFLKNEHIKQVLVRCDLHFGWQAACAGWLVEMGFNLHALEPEAGTGDVIVLSRSLN